VLVNLAVLVSSLLLVALIELGLPRRRREYPALRRRLGNLGFWVLNMVLAGFIFESPARFRAELEAVAGVNFPSWPLVDAGLSFVVGFLLLDLLRYVVHRCKHAMPLLWRFHALHHSDPDVDVTTSVRQHPGEYLLGSAVLWAVVIALNIPAFVWVTYGVAVFVTDAVQHGNVRLPERVERWLQPVLVTVDMHRIHHSISCDEANTNFGSVFSLWDRLFGTYVRLPRAQQERIVFGVRELPRDKCLKPAAMLLTPWRLSRAAAD
jgi:sterol desaturase/sphingolipid hydroxylase (fatty acid hydroxylase superfamily)